MPLLLHMCTNINFLAIAIKFTPKSMVSVLFIMLQGYHDGVFSLFIILLLALV